MAWPTARLTGLQQWKHDRVPLLVVLRECGQKAGRRTRALRSERTACED
jgi:hypothetical protein